MGEKARRARPIAAEEGASPKTALLTMFVIGDDHADAVRRAEHLIDGADIIALTNAGLGQASDSRARTAAHGAVVDDFEQWLRPELSFLVTPTETPTAP